jgi:uncharacterized membrane protein
MSRELAGALAAFAAAGLYAAAVALQALEARQVAHHHSLRLSLIDRLARRPVWVIGASVGLLGWCAQAVALLFAPLTLVEPILTMTLVLLLVVGARQLGEHVGLRERVGVLAVAAGVAGMAVAAPAHASRHPDGPALAVGLVCLLAVVAAPHAFRRTAPPGAIVPVSAGVGYALVAVSTKFAADDLHAHAWHRLAAWLVLTGAVGGLAVLSEMSSLQSQPVTRVAPVVFGLNVAVPVALAPVLAGERWGHSTATRALILSSLTAVVAGAVMLTRSRALGLVLANEAEAAAHHGVPHAAESA